MKIGILGTGDVGRALGKGFVERGDQVMIGSRDPNSDKLNDWKKANGASARTGSFADAAKFGEIIVLATLWSGTESALNLAGKENLKGKVVIDCTNPLVFGPTGPQLALGHTDSGGEQIQRWIPDAKVVKAFNIVGNPDMVKPDFPGGPPDMWIAGNDADAKTTVTKILSDFGWPVIDTGGIEGARLLEPLCILWVNYGARYGTWRHAFKLLRK